MNTSELDVFVHVARQETFAAAAKATGLSPATVMRTINALEARLNVRLFTRTTRQCRMTEEGRRYLARCEPLLADLRDAEDELTSGRMSASGTLRIAAPISFGRRHIAPLLQELRAAHPQIAASLTLSDESDDLSAAEYDCAIRVGLPRSGSYITRRLLKARRIVCASPAYLAAHERPEHPADLLQHTIIALQRDGQVQDRWMFEVDGVMETRRIPASLSSNSGEVTQRWALDGAGIALKSLWDVEDELASGALVELLPGYAADRADIFLVYPAREYVPARLRLFIDLISLRLAGYGDRLSSPSTE
ncbi:LysR family transcriptional regulator [Frigidibacter sp. MR17.14]|uniref:LysR family transcriptional regulator n=1 Tax=Frigidibacter sp. MR17.14 TaxID=3126509 RepID=UPI0030129F89